METVPINLSRIFIDCKFCCLAAGESHVLALSGDWNNFFTLAKTKIFNCLDNKEKLYAWGKTKFFNFKENFETEFMLTPHKIKLVSRNSVKGKFENPSPRTDILNNLEEMLFVFINLTKKILSREEFGFDNICAQDTLSFIVL